MLALTPPVPGPIVRPFAYAGSPFARGLHRGIDVRATPGDPVAAPCAGEVAYAGGYGVTLRCGRYRVTLIDLRPAVRSGARAKPGERVGAAKAGTIHLGVRRANDPFGYVDPAPLLRRAPRPPPLVGPRSPRSPPSSLPRPAPLPRVESGRVESGRVESARVDGGRVESARVETGRAAALAPWPAWAGLALVLTGGAGAGVRRRRARRRVVASSPAWPST